MSYLLPVLTLGNHWSVLHHCNCHLNNIMYMNHTLCYMFFCNQTFEVTVDSHEVVRNKCSRHSLPNFPQCQNLTKYKVSKEDIDNDSIHWPYSDFLTFTCTYLCVYIPLCIVVCNFMSCVGLCIHHHSEDTEQFHQHEDFLCCPFIVILTSPIPAPPPSLNLGKNYCILLL